MREGDRREREGGSCNRLDGAIGERMERRSVGRVRYDGPIVAEVRAEGEFIQVLAARSSSRRFKPRPTPGPLSLHANRKYQS